MSNELGKAIPMPVPVAPQAVPPKTFVASVYPDEPLEQGFGEAVQELESALGMPVWLVVQNEHDHADPQHRYCVLGEDLKDSTFHQLSSLPPKKHVAVLIDSPGGEARAAYQIARLLQRHCNGFVAVIPRQAKSAATLLALGANRVLMHEHAELGPLDAQIFDRDREEYGSALNEVQALERLHASAMDLFDSTMVLLLQRSGKRVDTVMPLALDFIAKTTRPLFEKLDTVHLTATSRVLKVAESYAIRLLKPIYKDHSEQIARNLVYNYPEHGFVIDHDEAASLGLLLDRPSDAQNAALERIIPFLESMTAVGLVKEKS